MTFLCIIFVSCDIVGTKKFSEVSINVKTNYYILFFFYFYSLEMLSIFMFDQCLVFCMRSATQDSSCPFSVSFLFLSLFYHHTKHLKLV